MLGVLNFFASRFGVDMAWRMVTVWLPLGLAVLAAGAAATAAWQLGRAPLLVQIAQTEALAAKRVADAQKAYAATVQADNTFVAAAAKDARQLDEQFKTLKDKFNALYSKRTKLVMVAAPSPGGGANCAVGGAAPPANTPTDGSDGAASGALLTAGAVWMWDSALTGTDQPANTCGAADTSPAACAAATKVTLDDAWANHTTNAEACAKNRLEHQQLIDLIQQRQGAKP